MTLIETSQLLGNFGEFVGAIAVVATLIYLARQISESNRLARSSSAHDAMSGFGVVNELIVANPTLAGLLARLKSPGAELTSAESVQFEHFCLRVINVYLEAQSAYDNGHMDDNTYRIRLNDVDASLHAYPGMADYFEVTLQRYPSTWNHEIIQKVRDAVSRRDQRLE